jgi:hypothetical protein
MKYDQTVVIDVQTVQVQLKVKIYKMNTDVNGCSNSRIITTPEQTENILGRSLLRIHIYAILTGKQWFPNRPIPRPHNSKGPVKKPASG